jgi:hypothetical protein
VADAFEEMTGGAAPFTPGVFNDLGLAGGAKTPAKRQAPASSPTGASAGGLSISTLIANMVNTASAFFLKLVYGDTKGATGAFAQMLGCATSFASSHFF